MTCCGSIIFQCIRAACQGVLHEPLLVLFAAQELGDGWTLACGSAFRLFSRRYALQSIRSFLFQRVRPISISFSGRKTNQTFCSRFERAAFVFHMEDIEAGPRGRHPPHSQAKWRPPLASKCVGGSTNTSAKCGQPKATFSEIPKKRARGVASTK